MLRISKHDVMDIIEDEYILITVHDNADADAVGSALALKCFLDQLIASKFSSIKCVDVYFHEPISPRFAPIIGEEWVGKVIKPTRDSYDIIFCLDTATEARTAKDIRSYMSPYTDLYVIDHHPVVQEWGTVFFQRDAPSCSCLIENLMCDIISAYPVDDTIFPEFTLDVATLVFMGLVGDTGNFKFSNTDEEAFEVAAHCVEAGVNASQVSSYLSAHTKEQLQLGADFSKTIRFGTNFIYGAVTKEMIDKYGATQEDAGNMVERIRNIIGYDGAILFIQDEDAVRIRFRSMRKPIDILAKKFGGGGHPMASGAKVDGKIFDILDRVVCAAEEYFG